MQLRILLRVRESMGILQVPLIQSWRLGVSLSKGKLHCLEDWVVIALCLVFSGIDEKKLTKYVCTYVREFLGAALRYSSFILHNVSP